MDYRVDFDAMAWESPIPGMRQKKIERDGKRLRLVEYSKEMEPHWCEKGHIGYVLGGEFEIRYDAVTHVYGRGDGVFIPTGREHRHMGTVLSDTVLVVFVENV